MGSTQLEAPLDGKEVARNHAQVIAFNEAGAARKIASGRSIALSVLFFSQLRYTPVSCVVGGLSKYIFLQRLFVCVWGGK